MNNNPKVRPAIVDGGAHLILGHGSTIALGIDEAEALADSLGNLALQLRYHGFPQREGQAGPLFTSFGADAHSWNLDDDDLSDEDSDKSGRPGAGLVAGAIATWIGLQRTHRASVATLATVFNITPAMVREAVEAHHYMFVSGQGDDDSTFVELDGE